MPDELDVVPFATVEPLWPWPEVHHATIADRLEADGRMTPARRQALGR